MDGKYIINIVRRVSTKPTTNGMIKPFFYNRNPRNLEKMRIGRKPTGYGLEKDNYSFWHKLEVTRYSMYVLARLIHNSNKTVVQASTKEWAIQKHLYSAVDSAAYLTLGKVFAERCLESGIISFFCPYPYEGDSKTKINLFLKALRNDGLILNEAPVYKINDIWIKDREKRPWTVLED